MSAIHYKVDLPDGLADWFADRLNARTGGITFRSVGYSVVFDADAMAWLRTLPSDDEDSITDHGTPHMWVAGEPYPICAADD